MNPETLSGRIKRKALESGYDLCGITDVESVKEYICHLDKRVARFPESRHLYEKLYNLGKPEEKAAWAKSIIVCIRRYNKYRIPEDLDRFFGKVYLFDGRLTGSLEYLHKTLFEASLKDLGLKVFNDFLPARVAAYKAGLGNFGRNNFIYTQYGSWVWIDTWMVNNEMDYDKPSGKECICPENCRRCIESCPTHALTEPLAMDRGLCVAQLSYFSSALPAEDLRESMGPWLYGCDACQNACPLNNGKWNATEDFHDINEIAENLSLEKIVTMDEETYREIIQPRFSYIGKESLWLWKCNALRAMANTNNPEYHPYLRNACCDHDEKVKTMALWACKRSGI